MSTRWHIGAKHLRGALAAYAKRFDFLEVHAAIPDHDAASPGPSLATLRRWRKSVPTHFDFAVVAGPPGAVVGGVSCAVVGGPNLHYYHHHRVYMDGDRHYYVTHHHRHYY